MMHQVLQQFRDVEPFLSRHRDISPATHTKLLNTLSDPQQLLQLKSELAAIIDIGSYYTKATCTLEGDGVLMLKCYEEIVKIREAIRSKHYPNVQAVA